VNRASASAARLAADAARCHAALRARVPLPAANRAECAAMMRRFALAICVAMLAFASAAAWAAPERRCGWLVNPTPGNWWLTDRDGEWVLGSQGQEPVAGMEAIPDMTTRDWVATNGSYGYGCACLTVETAPRRQVLRVLAATQLPIARCRADRALPAPG
jgi:hypothetical protein